MSAIDVNAYQHIMSNQEKSKPHHIHPVQNIRLFQPMAGSIFLDELMTQFSTFFWGETTLAFMVGFVHLGQFHATEGHLGYTVTFSYLDWKYG